MFTITRVRIQILNGNKVEKEIPLRASRSFATEADVDTFRQRTLATAKKRILKNWTEKHPGHDEPTIEILFNVAADKWYQQRLLKKKEQ